MGLWHTLQKSVAVADFFDGIFHPLAFFLGDEENVALGRIRLPPCPTCDLNEGSGVINLIVGLKDDDLQVADGDAALQDRRRHQIAELTLLKRLDDLFSVNVFARDVMALRNEHPQYAIEAFRLINRWDENETLFAASSIIKQSADDEYLHQRAESKDRFRHRNGFFVVTGP